MPNLLLWSGRSTSGLNPSSFLSISMHIARRLSGGLSWSAYGRNKEWSTREMVAGAPDQLLR
jgi:hypothetical protein